jgi:hypothetical protein
MWSEGGKRMVKRRWVGGLWSPGEEGVGLAVGDVVEGAAHCCNTVWRSA